MAMQTVPCATSPFVSRTSCTTTVPLRVDQMICRGAPPQLTTTKTRNMAFVQVNVRLVNYSTRETKENICFGAVKSPCHNSHPDSALHIRRKCQWREMRLPLHFFGQGIWQLHHRGPHRWVPLVCHHSKLWPGQKIWLLPQQRYEEEKRISKCTVCQSPIVLNDFLTLSRYNCHWWKFWWRALPLPLRVPRERVWFLHQWGQSRWQIMVQYHCKLWPRPEMGPVSWQR